MWLRVNLRRHRQTLYLCEVVWGNWVNVLIYLCYNLCFIHFTQLVRVHVWHVKPGCSGAHSGDVSSYFVLLQHFWFGVTYLFWSKPTIQVSPESLTPRPPTWKRFRLQPDTEQACTMWDWMCHLIPTLRVPLPSSCNAHTSVNSPR